MYRAESDRIRSDPLLDPFVTNKINIASNYSSDETGDEESVFEYKSIGSTLNDAKFRLGESSIVQNTNSKNTKSFKEFTHEFNEQIRKNFPATCHQSGYQFLKDHHRDVHKIVESKK